jgi:hypothetical protein
MADDDDVSSLKKTGSSSNSGGSNIEVFGRVRPSRKKVRDTYHIENDSKIDLFLPRTEEVGYIDHKKDHFDFQFNKVFDQETTQETIFEGEFAMTRKRKPP